MIRDGGRYSNVDKESIVSLLDNWEEEDYQACHRHEITTFWEYHY